MARDRATAVVAAVALLALAVVPWGVGTSSALALAFGGSVSLMWLSGAAVATTLFAALGRDRETAVTSALAEIGRAHV